MKLIAIILSLGMLGAGPSSQPTSENELRAIIVALQQQVAQLKAENEKLREQLIASLPPTTRSSPVSLEIAKAIKQKKLMVGMTMDQAIRSLGREGKLVYESETMKTYEWPYDVQRGTIQGYPRMVRGGKYVVNFEGGKISSVSDYPE